MLTGKYDHAANGTFDQPFEGKSDKDGKIAIQLPVNQTRLWAGSEHYQLPAKMGRRRMEVAIENEEPFDLTMVLQPVGLDVLGDWEDLCGFVFG